MSKWFILFVLFIAGCESNSSKSTFGKILKSYKPSYAKLFRIDYIDSGKVISIFNREDSIHPLIRYILTKNPIKKTYDCQSVSDTIQNIICLSTTHFSAFSMLEQTPLVKGIANKHLLCTAAPNVIDIGKDFEPDYEKIMQLSPQIIFTDAEYGNQSEVVKKLNSLHQTVVFSRDYYETNPLARAEWIVFFAAFINKEESAIAIFNKKANEYNTIKQAAQSNKYRPTVFCNIPYQGIWYMPSKESYVAKLIADAGGNLLWQDSLSNNGLNISLDFEMVFKKAVNADYWINTGLAQSLNELKAQDTRFTKFASYQNKKVFNATMCNKGGVWLWEKGIFEPEKILQDYIAIFQGRDDPFHYYQKLK